MARREHYSDLVDAIERGAVAGDGRLERRARRNAWDELPRYDELRAHYTVELASWDRMIEDLLAQVGADAGSVLRALAMFGVDNRELVAAWVEGPAVGTRASVSWLARRPRSRPAEPRERLRSVLVRRGDSYDDLADAARRFRVRGDGRLDPARLRRSYTIERRRPWLRMVGDLLGQVVADAGSLERGAAVLAVPLGSLAQWVRWLVSRGSVEAAWSTWPLPTGDEIDPTMAYADLVDAVERGSVDGDNVIDGPELRDSYTVRLDRWELMTGELVRAIVADAGSIRSAAKVLDVPRSTLNAWVKRHRGQA